MTTERSERNPDIPVEYEQGYPCPECDEEVLSIQNSVQFYARQCAECGTWLELEPDASYEGEGGSTGRWKDGTQWVAKEAR